MAHKLEIELARRMRRLRAATETVVGDLVESGRTRAASRLQGLRDEREPVGRRDRSEPDRHRGRAGEPERGRGGAEPTRRRGREEEADRGRDRAEADRRRGRAEPRSERGGRDRMDLPAPSYRQIIAGRGAQEMGSIATVDGGVPGAFCTLPGFADQPNQDAVVVRVRPGDPERGIPELTTVGILNQDRKKGESPDGVAAASWIGAEWIDQMADWYEQLPDPTIDDLQTGLAEAANRTHAELRDRGHGEQASFAAFVQVAHPWDKDAPVTLLPVTVGSSRVAAVPPRGEILATPLDDGTLEIFRAIEADPDDIRPPDPHDLANGIMGSQLTNSLGADYYKGPMLDLWTLSPGSRYALYSEGLGDSRRRERFTAPTWHADALLEDIDRILWNERTPRAAVGSLVGFAVGQAREGKARPEDLSVYVGFVPEGTRS